MCALELFFVTLSFGDTHSTTSYRCLHDVFFSKTTFLLATFALAVAQDAANGTTPTANSPTDPAPTPIDTKGMSVCIIHCGMQAGQTANCNFTNPECACHNRKYRNLARACVHANCSYTEILDGYARTQGACIATNSKSPNRNESIRTTTSASMTPSIVPPQQLANHATTAFTSQDLVVASVAIISLSLSLAL